MPPFAVLLQQLSSLCLVITRDKIVKTYIIIELATLWSTLFYKGLMYQL